MRKITEKIFYHMKKKLNSFFFAILYQFSLVIFQKIYSELKNYYYYSYQKARERKKIIGAIAMF